MQRLGELNNKVIVEQKTAPENKYVIWKDPVEDKFKEYKDGSWVESEEIAIPSKNFIFSDYLHNMINVAEPSKYLFESGTSEIVTIDYAFTKGTHSYSFLYKKTDFDNLSGDTMFAMFYHGNDSNYIDYAEKGNVEVGDAQTTVIDGETYIYWPAV